MDGQLKSLVNVSIGFTKPLKHKKYLHFTVMTCGELTLNNGNINYTSNEYIFESVAVHTCDADNGYVLSDPNITTRICLVGGWSGSEISCQSW